MTQRKNRPQTSKVNADVTVVIVSYNSSFWLKKTLASFYEFVVEPSRFSFHIRVVDNGSSDDSVAMVQATFPDVELLALPTNTGFSAGNNAGLAELKSRYVMLLNSDVESTELSSLDGLIEYMDDNSEVAVITPKLVMANGSLDWASHRGEPTLWAAATYFTGLAKVFPQVPWLAQYHLSFLDLHTIHQIDACSGAAMLVRTAAIQQVGLLDEQFFFYAEDLDWCRRFREAGWKILYYPKAELVHHKYKSGLSSHSAQTQRKTRAYFYDTMLQYYDKHYRAQYPEFVRWIVKQVLILKKGGL